MKINSIENKPIQSFKKNYNNQKNNYSNKTSNPNSANQPNGEMDNLEYKIIPLKFLPEDEEKMANMSVSEKIEYIRYIKSMGRFIIQE